MKTLLTLLLLSLLSASTLFSEQSATPTAPDPCAMAEQKQFDFWLGEWDLTWPGEHPGEVGHGTNSVQRILDGCVVQESFSGRDSMHLRGTSVSTFDPTAGKWKQTWVDNEGGYLDFVGGIKDGQMILQREAARKDGAENPAAHGLEKHYRQRTGLELGSFSRRRQDLASPVANSLQEKGLTCCPICADWFNASGHRLPL